MINKQTSNNLIYQKWQIVKRDAIQNRYVYIMLIPVIAFYVIFHYGPLYGAQIAFKSFSPSKGIFGSPWIGLQHFNDFLSSFYFKRILWNTIALNLLDIIFGFPAPIILALLLNEIKNSVFKRTVQTITYIPHFISLVVVCSLILDFLSRDGVVNQIIVYFGFKPIPFMARPEWFRPVFVGSNIWQNIGWGSIIYLAALSGINPELYEAAKIDGANRWRQTWHVTIPVAAA
ncbi:MAG: ABC transporter permease subunit, partial [Bacteroidales bacterium]